MDPKGYEVTGAAEHYKQSSKKESVRRGWGVMLTAEQIQHELHMQQRFDWIDNEQNHSRRGNL
jgi:hypothetical protein